MKQPLYQIYLPVPKYISRPNAGMLLFAKQNDIHQADILYLPHDRYEKKVYKYALNIVDNNSHKYNSTEKIIATIFR